MITRDGAAASSRSRSPWVSRKYDMWLVANVSSSPSAVTRRVPNIAPALLISTSMRGSAAAISADTRRVSAMSERSARCARCATPGPRSRRRPSVASARTPSRAISTIRAPMAASASAATSPMPEVPPVITTTLSRMARLFTVSGDGVQAVR